MDLELRPPASPDLGRPGAAAGRPAQPLSRRRDRRREGDPDASQRRPSSCSRPASSAWSSSGATRRARTCRASRRSSTRRSARSSSGSRPSRPRRSPSTSRSSCAPGRARGAPRSASRPASPSTSRRPCRASTRRSCTRCTAAAVATELGTRRLIGVTAQGMTACPCAQELVATQARAAAREPRASTTSDIDRILDAVPGRDPQPARPRDAAHRLHRAVRRRDRRRHAAGDRRARRCRRRSTS